MGFWVWEKEKISNVPNNYCCYFCNFYSLPFPKKLNEKTINNVILEENKNVNDKEKEKEKDKEIEKENLCIHIGNEGSYYDLKNINNINNDKDNKIEMKNDTTRNKINKILLNNLNKLPKIIRHRLHSSKDSIEESEEIGLLSDENVDISLNSNMNTKSLNFLQLPVPRKKLCQMV